MRPYRAGRGVAEVAAERGLAGGDVVKLASNENPLGAGELALAALREMRAADVSRYPLSGGGELTRELARRLGVGEERIILGNGSNDILVLAGQLTLAPGVAAAFSRHAFLLYSLIAAGFGAEAAVAPAGTDFGHDLESLAAAARGKNVRAVFVANPNNPTGTWHPPDVVREFLREVPGDVLAVLDEAYCEYLADEGRGSLELLAEFPNLLITRTFSKIHGLAGLRAGYGIGDAKIIAALNAIRQPFNISAPARIAALAALGDDAHIARSRKTNEDGMRELRAGLDSLGLRVLPSFANFLCFAINDAAAIYERLLDKGVVARRLDAYGLPDMLRVTVGLPGENEKFLSALAESLSAGEVVTVTARERIGK